MERCWVQCVARTAPQSSSLVPGEYYQLALSIRWVTLPLLSSVCSQLHHLPCPSPPPMLTH